MRLDRPHRVSSAIDAVIVMCNVSSGLAVPLERRVDFCGISAMKAGCIRGFLSRLCCPVSDHVWRYVGVAVNGVQVNVTLCMSRAKISQVPPRFRCMRRRWSLGMRLSTTNMVVSATHS